MVVSKQLDVHSNRHDSNLCSGPRTIPVDIPLEMDGMAVSVSRNRDSPAGPGSSPDGCCLVLTSSCGFQGM